MRTKHLFVLIHIINEGEVGTIKLSSPVKKDFTDRSNAEVLLWILFVIYFSSCFVMLSRLFIIAL